MKIYQLSLVQICELCFFNLANLYDINIFVLGRDVKPSILSTTTWSGTS